MQNKTAGGPSSPNSIPLEVLKVEWAQIFGAITNERTKPPTGWAKEDWEAL